MIKYNDFDFITKKLSTNEVLYKLYQNTKFRQYKWYAFINKKRTEDRIFRRYLIIIWNIMNDQKNIKEDIIYKNYKPL